MYLSLYLNRHSKSLTFLNTFEKYSMLWTTTFVPASTSGWVQTRILDWLDRLQKVLLPTKREAPQPPALGDQRPSELLASIRNLQPVKKDCGCYCARYQFLSRVPPITRAQLANQKDLTVDEPAALADTIMLSQASVQSLMAELDADRHNSEVLAVRQRVIILTYCMK